MLGLSEASHPTNRCAKPREHSWTAQTLHIDWRAMGLTSDLNGALMYGLTQGVASGATLSPMWDRRARSGMCDAGTRIA
jgi:hypothetical protein